MSADENMARLPLWTAAPPKEGRVKDDWQATLRSPKTKTLVQRLTFVALIATILYLVLARSPSALDSPDDGLSRRRQQQPLSDDDAPLLGSDNNDIEEHQDVPDVTPQIVVSKPKTPSNLAKNPKLESALTRVLSMLPSEITMRELLRPVPGTGKEKLKEYGLRARAYRTHLEAWEELHFVEDGDNLYIRDDVIQYLRAHVDFAESLSASLADTIRNYEAYRYFLQKLANLCFPYTAPYFGDHMSLHTHFRTGGRGIVLSSGDGQAPFLLTSIQSFRKLGCTLPIEIMYLGENDLGEDFRAELEALPGVVTRDMAQMVSDSGWTLRGWAAKPFAMLLSSFREVIFIDADALFFRDPAILFDDPLYEKTGTLFFKDRIIMPESKKEWLKQVLPHPLSKQVRTSRYWTGVSGHMQESGVVVVDKWRHFVAMLLVTRMNGPDRDGNKDKHLTGVYDMVYGDKETYWLGWELVGDLEYAFHEGDAGIIGTLQTQEQIDARKRKKAGKKDPPPPPANNTTELVPPTENTICAPQLLHLDMENKPLWFNGWILNNKFAEKKKKSAARFDYFMREPTDGRTDPDPWQLQASNEACLTADEAYPFSAEDTATLDMIVAIAKKEGAYGKKG